MYHVQISIFHFIDKFVRKKKNCVFIICEQTGFYLSLSFDVRYKKFNIEKKIYSIFYWYYNRAHNFSYNIVNYFLLLVRGNVWENIYSTWAQYIRTHRKYIILCKTCSLNAIFGKLAFVVVCVKKRFSDSRINIKMCTFIKYVNCTVWVNRVRKVSIIIN